MRAIIVFVAIAAFAAVAFPQAEWRRLTEPELTGIVPEKAPVIKENIETEFRTAAGITDGTKSIFGVVIITAGYEADGKYTHFFKSDLKIKVGGLELPGGEYIFGYQRIDAETLRVTFYRARDGELLGAIKAKVEPKKGAIYSFLIDPPSDGKGKVYIGRFVFEYVLQ